MYGRQPDPAREGASLPRVRHDEVLWREPAVHKGIGMGLTRASWRALALAALGGILAALGACSAGIQLESAVQPGRSCVDDSPSCVAQRRVALKSLLTDKTHSWINQPADADTYASGVRLFAYKTRKREFNCRELAAGMREANAGPALLRGPAGRHLTPAQISRGVMFSNEVSLELAREMRRRCRV